MSKVYNKEDIRKNIIKPVVLIGLGPHAKRIYMHYFLKYEFTPKLIIDLESKSEEVEKYLCKNNLKIETFFIPDKFRDSEELPLYLEEDIVKKLNELNIKNAIISTEPKAHFAYLKIFLKNNISTLTDKPITSPINVCNNIERAKKIEADYECLKDLYIKAKANNVSCRVQCQRRWHEGYNYIWNVLEECIKEYGVPITSIDVYHCDGKWIMPYEILSLENHPYKYGYGKLFHSGYHFIDIISWFLKLNDNIVSKKADNVELYTTITSPNDYINIINEKDYKKILNSERSEEVYKNREKYNFDQCGEMDFSGLMQFKKGDNVITNCSISLFQNGFSRRSWDVLPEDTYKGNGRVRHERINIQVGPLMNIQVHSYQSTEIKDRDKEIVHNEVGALEHFDIYIFRNKDILGGKSFEKITLNDLITDNDKKNFIGYNERARENCIIEFLMDENKTSDLLDHDLGIKLLMNSYISICKRKQGESPIIKFDI